MKFNNTYSLVVIFCAIFFAILVMTVIYRGYSSDHRHFVGVWRLLSITYSDGRENTLCGSNPLGYIMYTKDGHMSVHIMRRVRENFHSDELAAVTPAEAQKLWGDYFAYAGTFTADKKQKVVTHHVKMSLFPNYIDKALQRRYRFEGDKLYLTTIAATAGEIEQTLVWQRVKPNDSL